MNVLAAALLVTLTQWCMPLQEANQFMDGRFDRLKFEPTPTGLMETIKNTETGDVYMVRYLMFSHKGDTACFIKLEPEGGA